MAGEVDLAVLLQSMRPELHPHPYGYAVSDLDVPGAFARIVEAEGVTVIAPVEALRRAGIDAAASWARISLRVHSDLAAVGLTAALARVLADQGISANVVAGFYHDHVLVPWDRRADAMAALKGLSDV